uniref:60S ribosomal protein L18a-like protein n=1 Tax=Ananas comosus var. bracteatus TaxID=296719 RepID=A0A6V7QI84_ANACO|nr:unnamed protein product [Ananas comosus var. bracteatus]
MTSKEEGKSTGEPQTQQQQQQQQQQYGTFQGVPTYPPQPPAMGFPQPTPPPGITGQLPPHSAPTYYARAYQTAAPGYEQVVEGRPLREPRLPCCGCGVGWFLFIIGFFLAAIPWYVGAFILLCVRRVDYREKPGYIACTIAAVLAAIAIIIGATKGADAW